MVRKSLRQSIRQQPKCANCNHHSINQLLFTEALPKWMRQASNGLDESGNRHNQVSINSENDAKISGSSGESTTEEAKPEIHADGSIRHLTSTRIKSRENFITVFDALLKVFEMNFKYQKALLKSTKNQKENLRLCNNCVWCLSQIYDGLSRFTKLTQDAKSKSYLHEIIFPVISNSFGKNDLVETTEKNQGCETEHFILSTNDEDPQPSDSIDVDTELLIPKIQIQLNDIKMESEDQFLDLHENHDEEDWEATEGLRKRCKRKSSPFATIRAPSSRKLKQKRRRQVSSLRYICAEKDCAFQGNEKEQYNDHLLSSHGITIKKPRKKTDNLVMPNSSDLHPCVICNYSFASEEEVFSHCSAAHVPSIRTRSHICSECPKAFVSNRDLRSHEATHAISTAFSCDKCPFKTRRNQELERHEKLVHTQEKSYFCPEPNCGKGFALRWQLTDHMRIHNEERNYSCLEPGCGKTFRTPSNLRQHSQLHRGSKYVCDICGQSYSRKAYLRLHMNGTHLMLPLPPSLKREKRKRNPEASMKLPRVKSTARREPKSRTIVIEKDMADHQSIVVEPDIFSTNSNQNSSFVEIGSVPEEEENIIEDYNNQDQKADYVVSPSAPAIVQDSAFHVQLELDSTERDDIVLNQEDGRQMANLDPNTFSLSDGHQIICYPVGMNIISTEGGNTFYITTAPTQQSQQGIEEPASTPITVFSSLTDFLSNQH